MAAVFWLFVLGVGVLSGQAWAILIAVVLLICLGLASNRDVAVDSQGMPVTKPRPAKAAPPPEPRPARAPAKQLPPAPTADDMRRLQRQWRKEDHQRWDEDFDRLAASAAPVTPSGTDTARPA